MNFVRMIADVDMNSVMNNGMSIGERLANGGQMILMVMACVFGVIFTIWLMQTLFTAGVTAAMNKKSKAKAEPVAPVKPEPIPEPEATDDNEVTVAIITAAVAAYLQAESADGAVPAFRVVSFKRKNAGKPWNSQN